MLKRRVAVLVAVPSLLAACGDSATFTAEEFVDQVNAEGVELSLGQPLQTTQEGQELYDVQLQPVAELPGDEGGGGHSHSAGSLSVFDDVEGADSEIESCRGAADLLCYQAGNVVVVLQTGGIEAQQLAKAMERLTPQ
jgi:hypothetical protein